MTPDREGELYDEFERLEGIKRQRLSYLMGAVLLWNLLFVNFFILPKENGVVLPDGSTDYYYYPISDNQILLMQMNFVFFGLFVMVLVFHIENEIIQAFNYFVFYVLYLAVIVPIFPAPKEIYIPIWLLVVGIYFTMSILMNSLPFVLYPSSNRWFNLKRQYLQQRNSTIITPSSANPPPPSMARMPPMTTANPTLVDQKAIIIGSNKEKVQ